MDIGNGNTGCSWANGFAHFFKDQAHAKNVGKLAYKRKFLKI